MKIESIYIGGFGVWSAKTWEPLSPGINLFYGPNEAGKSTLMAFVRAILFGFERRGGARRYEPANGGAHGGCLDLNVDGRRIRVERKAGRSAKGTVVVTDANGTGGEDQLNTLLGGTTRTLYHNVFAFGLEELEQFHTLEETEVAQHIAGAGLGVGAARWSAVQRDLEDRQSALFLPRGQSSEINVGFKELDAARDELDRTEHQPQDYWAARDAKTRLSVEVSGLEEALAEVERRAAHYEKRLKSKPHRETRNRIDARLAAMPAVDTFPEGGVERLALLERQRLSFDLERGQLQRENERRRSRRGELSAAASPDDYARRQRVLEMLRALGPQLESARRLQLAAAERHTAAQRGKVSLDAAAAQLRPPSLPAFLIFVGLIWAGAAGFAAMGRDSVAVAALTVSLLPLLWYRRRVAEFAIADAKTREAATALEATIAAWAVVNNETADVESEIRKLIGKTEISAEDLEVRAAELERLSLVFEEIRRVDETIERVQTEVERVQARLNDAKAAIAALFAEARATASADFLEKADIFKRRRELLAERDRIPLDLPETGLLFEMGVSEEEAHETACREREDLRQRLAAARHESGRVEERIAIMERSEERARALTKQETVVEKIEDAADRWAVLTLCRALLDETRKVYENDRQPQTLRHASTFFNVMTGGRYQRAIAPLDGTEIQVERADGVRLAPSLLSRGTAEQLYLSMRLALIREYASHVDPLPVVFDDVFVNFDPGRIRGAIQAVQKLAETHQALVFTCHPHMVALFEEIVPDLTVFHLQ